MKKKVIMILIIIVIAIVAKNSYSQKDISYKTEYVVMGDTLWSIATDEKDNNSYYKNKDIRSIVTDIKYINNLNSSELVEGMELKIPVY